MPLTVTPVILHQGEAHYGLKVVAWRAFYTDVGRGSPTEGASPRDRPPPFQRLNSTHGSDNVKVEKFLRTLT